MNVIKCNRVQPNSTNSEHTPQCPLVQRTFQMRSIVENYSDPHCDCYLQNVNNLLENGQQRVGTYLTTQVFHTCSRRPHDSCELSRLEHARDSFKDNLILFSSAEESAKGLRNCVGLQKTSNQMFRPLFPFLTCS